MTFYGLSSRAIAATMGVSQRTVLRDLPPESVRLVNGTDGKVYRNRQLSSGDREFVHGRTHWLQHDEGLSVRQIREYWLYNHNLRRSIGTISALLRQPCEKCSRAANASPEHLGDRSEPDAVVWGGLLASDLLEYDEYESPEVER